MVSLYLMIGHSADTMHVKYSINDDIRDSIARNDVDFLCLVHLEIDDISDIRCSIDLISCSVRLQYDIKLLKLYLISVLLDRLGIASFISEAIL